MHTCAHTHSCTRSGTHTRVHIPVRSTFPHICLLPAPLPSLGTCVPTGRPGPSAQLQLPLLMGQRPLWGGRLRVWQRQCLRGPPCASQVLCQRTGLRHRQDFPGSAQGMKAQARCSRPPFSSCPLAEQAPCRAPVTLTELQKSLQDPAERFPSTPQLPGRSPGHRRAPGLFPSSS